MYTNTQTTLPDRGLIPEVRRRASSRAGELILLATLLLAQSLPRKRFFGPALLARLHIEAVLLDFLDDVFLLHFPLKATECILKRLTLLNDYFCQCISPQFRFGLDDCSASILPWALRLVHYRTRLLASCSQFQPIQVKHSFLQSPCSLLSIYLSYTVTSQVNSHLLVLTSYLLLATPVTLSCFLNLLREFPLMPDMRDALAVLLAGGQGERLWPLTRDRAKPAVPFGGALPHHRHHSFQLRQFSDFAAFSS